MKKTYISPIANLIALYNEESVLYTISDINTQNPGENPGDGSDMNSNRRHSSIWDNMNH